MIVPSNLYSVLTHPHRRTIIREIYLEREGTIKHFRESLQFKTGTLYHHLKILVDSKLITQNEDRKYLLTPFGEKVVIELLDEEAIKTESFSKDKSKLSPETVNLLVINRLTTVERVINQIFDEIYFDSKVLLTINLIAVFFLFLNLVYLKLGILGCFMFPTGELILSLVSLLMSILIIPLLIWILPKMFGKSEPITKEFIILTTSLYIPISIASSVIRLIKIVPLGTEIQTVLILGFQLIIQLLWIIWIYLIGKEIFIVEKKSALIISFMINYLMLSLVLLVLS